MNTKLFDPNFRQSVESRRRSGFGRMVLLFFFESIWSRSHATISIETAIELSNISTQSSPFTGDTANSEFADSLVVYFSLLIISIYFFIYIASGSRYLICGAEISVVNFVRAGWLF